MKLKLTITILFALCEVLCLWCVFVSKELYGDELSILFRLLWRARARIRFFQKKFARSSQSRSRSDNREVTTLHKSGLASPLRGVQLEKGAMTMTHFCWIARSEVTTDRFNSVSYDEAVAEGVLLSLYTDEVQMFVSHSPQSPRTARNSELDAKSRVLWDGPH